ncbi:MAG TPA: Uma2 family endonuclease [Gemmatimonadales bacterium]|jgi:Uma2 family endonuclease|nr:Uma2 family endonuclease [Gemmatimonadales bacterium]
MNDLLLVIEVLSPFSARADRFTKRRLYQEAGVPLYWVVDPDERVIEVWTADARLPAIEKERVTWWPAGTAAPFVLPLEELFRPI